MALAGVSPNQALIAQLIQAFGVPGTIPVELAEESLGGAKVKPKVRPRPQIPSTPAGKPKVTPKPRPPTPRIPAPPGLGFLQRFPAAGAATGLGLGAAAGVGLGSQVEDPRTIGDILLGLDAPLTQRALESLVAQSVGGVTKHAGPVGEFFSETLHAPFIGNLISSLGLDPETIAAAEAAGITPQSVFDRPGPEPAPVEARPERAPVMLPSGAGPQQSTVFSPFVPFDPLEANFPEVPEIEAILNELEAAAPLPPSEIRKLPFILQGIAAGVRDVEGNVGEILLQAGLGALGGRGAFEQARIERQDLFNKETQEFLRALAEARAALGQQEFENLTEAERNRLEIDRLNQAGRAAEAEQLQPAVSGRTVITRRREGGRIAHDISQIPSATESLVSRFMPLIGLMAGQDLDQQFEGIMLQDPGAISRAAEELDILAQGVEIEDVDKARILQWIRQNEPDVLESGVMPMLQMRAILEALM